MNTRVFRMALVACSLYGGGALAAVEADTIYHGGDVITLDTEQPAAEAVAIKDGKILAVGKSTDVLEAPRRGDAGGRPCRQDARTRFRRWPQPFHQFIASRAAGQRLGSAGRTGQVDRGYRGPTQAAPTRPTNSCRDSSSSVTGTTETRLSDNRELSAADLDAAFPDNPVMVLHVSLHGAVLNSAALKKYDITAATKTPPGGVILRKEGSDEPAGLIMETAFLPVFARLPKPSSAQLVEQLGAGQAMYAAAGITTAQEGATHQADLDVLQQGAERGLLYLDVVAYPFITEAKEILKKNPPETFGTYHGRLKLGGIKITTDGSPQGKTAFFTTPYLTGGPAGQSGWRGEPTFPQAELEAMVKFVYDNHLQLLVHCNGDAAIDALLAAHEWAAGDTKSLDRRTTVVHSQFVRRDQLDKYVAYKLIPSFYTEHCFFFGDTHVKNRGNEQAYFISPMKTALGLGLHCATTPTSMWRRSINCSSSGRPSTESRAAAK